MSLQRLVADRKSSSLVAARKEPKVEPGGLQELEDIGRLVQDAEVRARNELKRNGGKASRSNDRHFAKALHCEADKLYHRGDYETALVLYHRAASLCPRDNSHGVAARRTAAAITSWNNSTKGLRKLFAKSKNETQLAVALCPELAAAEASRVLKSSPNPSSVSEVLWYFDSHKSFWTTSPAAATSKTRQNRPKVTPRQLNELASASLRNLETSFRCGDTRTAMRTAEQLLTLTCNFRGSHRYQIAAHHYLSLIHVSLGRHDRAVRSVSLMTRLSKRSESSVLFSRSLVTLGKVHLSFGHLDAAARAWQHLSEGLEEPLPRAWIHHEIGRCYLETRNYRKALDAAARCLEAAEEADSTKWLLHGTLLTGQALAKLARYAEALETLRVSARISEEEGDTPTSSYIRDLIGQVAGVLRSIAFDRDGAFAKIEPSLVAPKEVPGAKDPRPVLRDCIANRDNWRAKLNFEPAKRARRCQETLCDADEPDKREQTLTCPKGEESTVDPPDLPSNARRFTSNRSAGNDGKATRPSLLGNSTYRVGGSRTSSSERDTVSLDSCSSSVDDDDDTRRIRVIESGFRQFYERLETELLISTDEKKGEGASRTSRNSVATLKSERSNLTYVIERTNVSRQNRRKDVLEENPITDEGCETESSDSTLCTPRELVIDKYIPRQSSIPNMETPRSEKSGNAERCEETKNSAPASEVQKLSSEALCRETSSKIANGTASERGAEVDWISKLDVLNDDFFANGEKRERLLEIIDKTLRMSGEACRAFGNLKRVGGVSNALDAVAEIEKGGGGEECRTTRSCEAPSQGVSETIANETIHGNLTAHSLYRHSLPSSPRKREAANLLCNRGELAELHESR